MRAADRRVNHSSWHVQGVRIENDCWIGAGAIICAGVCIGEGSTVLEGTVVTKNVVPGDRVAGNPARGLQSQ
ncbi:Nodulation protein L like [Verticillium longisporum]|uniref:Nodulation protein L like n=1 Tax=Verticillium longisporum TaxID=100787 RepID=A0A8I3ARD8_VERLO|nr:Nodulation protein L like [Verticillium longisporum]